MIEDYIYTKLTENDTIQNLYRVGSDYFNIYVAGAERGNYERCIVFTLITTEDSELTKSQTVQLSIFSKKHSDLTTTSKAIEEIFNHTRRQKISNLVTVSSFRVGESDLGRDLDNEGFYHRQATYKFIFK